MPVHQCAAIRTTHCFLFERNVLSPVAKNFCHPDKFVEELIYTAHIGEKLSTGVENLLHRAKIHIPKYRNQPQFAQDRLKVLNSPGATKHAGGNAHNTGGLMNVFL